tara:strand:+ start:9282 stop:9473 length:192 start_codon:yes stop_codon:yes gene_type:complete
MEKLYIGNLIKVSLPFKTKKIIGIIIDKQKFVFGNDSLKYFKVLTENNQIIDVCFDSIKEKIK